MALIAQGQFTINRAAKDGQYTVYQYAKSTSDAVAPASGWASSPPTLSEGEYLWMQTGIVTPPATAPTSWAIPVRISGDKGDQGEEGTLNYIEWKNKWVLGNGIISGWTNNGAVDENIRVMGANPFGIQSMLWKCVPNADANASGGFETATVKLDANYAYRYSLFVYINKSGGTTYHGCRNVANLSDNAVNGNPYFWNGTTLPVGKWCLMVGIIHPNPITTQSGISGVYDMDGRKLFNGTDYKFASDGRALVFRSYLYYSTDSTLNQLFFNPTVHRLDGTEPSLDDILQTRSATITDASFKVLDDKIVTKVSQTDFTTLQGRVTSAESTIVQQASKIESTVTKVDGKNTVYKSLTSATTDRPAIPYAKNDLWITYTGEIKQSTVTRLTGAFVDGDWIATTKYTDDTAATEAKNFAEGRSYQAGKILYRDIDFSAGMNGIAVYNNAANGVTTIARIAKQADCPTSSAYCVEISNTGAASPALGGFFWGTGTRANAKFITRIIAKLPVNYSISYHSNTIGTGGYQRWITPTAGTGKYEEYINIVQSGSSGTFSSTNFYALNGTAGTAAAPVKWHLGLATVYDMTQAEIDYKSLADAAQTTANSKVQTYYSDTTPVVPTGGHKVGDLWYKISITDGCYYSYRWNGSAWQQINVYVSQAKQTITDSSINNLVTKTGIGSLGTNENLWSKINQTASQITLEVANAKTAVKEEVKTSLTLNNSGISLLGKTITLDGTTIAKAIETKDLVVGSRTGLSALEVKKTGVFYAKGSSADGASKLTIDSETQAIEIVSPKTQLGQGGITYSTTTMKMSSQTGTLEVRNPNGVTTLGAEGIFANRAGQTFMPAGTYMSNARAAIAGLGFGSGAAHETLPDYNAVIGVAGWANNTSGISAAPAYGGYFENLKATGFILNTKVVQGGSTYLIWSDSLVIGYGSSTVYLPTDYTVGRIVLIRAWAGTIYVYPPSGFLLYDDSSANTSIEVTEGTTAFCCFIKPYINSVQKNVWLINKWKGW